MSIERFTARSLSQAVRILGDGRQNFLSNQIFEAGRNHPTNIIDFGLMQVPAYAVPYSPAGGPAISVSKQTGASKTVQAPKIRLKKVFDENFASVLNPALDSYIGPYSNPNDQAAEKINLELMDLRRRIDRGVEIQCAQGLLTGTITLLDETGGTLNTVVFEYTGDGAAAGDTLTIQKTLSGTALWSGASSNPGDDLERLLGQIRDHSDYSGTVDVVMGQEAALAFLRNERVLKELDNRNLNVGTMAPVAQAYYRGMYRGIRIWAYSIGYVNSAGTRVAVDNAKKIIMLPSQGSGKLTVEHGAVWDKLTRDQAQAQFIQTDFFSKMHSESDPPVDELIVETRPLALVKDPSAIRVLKVLA